MLGNTPVDGYDVYIPAIGEVDHVEGSGAAMLYSLGLLLHCILHLY